jgi:2-dehydro-3-deoxyphosphogluconate aldolase / (4S)-4-hydroxy-2-oxoglutarate aldolase
MRGEAQCGGTPTVLWPNGRHSVVAAATALDAIRRARLLAIVRTDDAEHATTIVDTLLDSGVEAIEVSLTTPGAIAVIRNFASRASTTYMVGAGTVLTAEQAHAVAEAGAQFIVTPGISESIEVATELELPSLVGVLTPSEALEAIRRGASALKLFPAEIGGPAYLRALRAPLPTFEFIPVGGVTVDLVGEYLDAGAVALGVGSALTGSGSAVPDVGQLRNSAAAYLEAIRAWDERPG